MKFIKKSIQYVLPLVVGVGIFYMVYKDIDFNVMIEKLRQANFGWVALSLALTIVSHLARAVRWNMIIEPLGYKPKLINSMYALMIGYLANLALPRAGEVARCGVLSKYENMPLDKTFGTVITERIIDLMVLGTLVLISFAMEFELLSSLFNEMILPDLLAKLEFLGSSKFWMLAGGLFIIFAYLTFLVIKRYRDSAIVLKVKTTLFGFWEGIKTIRQMKSFWAYIIWTIVMWSCYFMMSYLCTFSLEATSGMSISAGFLLLSIGSIGIAAPVQGGMGTYHYMVAQLLLIYGIAYEDGALLAFVIHSSQTLFIVVFGFISLFAISYFSDKKKSEDVSL